MLSVFLLGSTDLTLSVAETVLSSGCTLAGLCHVGPEFSISYAKSGVKNTRYVDIPGWCAQHDMPCLRYESNEQLGAHLDEHGADFALAAGWYHMVPASIRDRFPGGCAGIHASLLPKLRGGAPLNWAILTGETETGVSIFQLDDAMDSGPLYGRRAFPIGPRATIRDLVELSTIATRELLVEVLQKLDDGSLRVQPQQGIPSYGLQRVPHDGLIDWSRSAEAIDRLIRAVSRPYPGAFTGFDNRIVRLWRAEPCSAPIQVYGAPGQIFHHRELGDLPGAVTGNGFLIIGDATYDDGADALPDLRRASQQRLVRPRE